MTKLCSQCGQAIPDQKVHCPKHDVLFNEGEECFACKEGQGAVVASDSGDTAGSGDSSEPAVPGRKRRGPEGSG